LAALIRAAGGEPLLFPALEIFDAEDLQPALALIERLMPSTWPYSSAPMPVGEGAGLVRPRAWRQACGRTVGRGSERELRATALPR